MTDETKREWPDVVSDVLEIQRKCSRHNWDGYNATAITHAEVGGAIAQLDRLRQLGFPPPHVVPTTNGNFQFEWDFGGVHVECEPPEWLIDAGEDMVTFGGRDD